MNGKPMALLRSLLDLGQPRPDDTVVVRRLPVRLARQGARAPSLPAAAPWPSPAVRSNASCASTNSFTTKRSTTRSASLPKRSGRPVYFDNTAGAISDAVLPQLAMGARVVICGTASVASWDPPPTGPRVERHLLVKRADVRIPGIRLSAPLRGSGGAARRPGARRQPALSRGH